MLNKLRELIIAVWSPVGEFFDSIFGTSNVWFPIIAYVLGSILILFIIKKILDMTVTKTSSLTISTILSLLKKGVIYAIAISIGLFLLLSLYFYLETLYNEYHQEQLQKEQQEQNLDYLLR
jgi:uncharacterized membrane protein